MSRSRRLLSIAHSYAVTLNRRLPNEIARVSKGKWDVTAVAPTVFHGSRDLRSVTASADGSETAHLELVPARLTSRVHLFHYGRRLRELLKGNWDLVHAWEEPFIAVGGQIARWTPRTTPLVYATFQNLPKTYPPPFNWIERYAMGRASGWIAFAQTVHETLALRKIYQARPVRIIPPGVDVEHFRRDRAAGESVLRSLGWATDGPPVVGYLGRFIPEKGLAMLTAAMDEVKAPWRMLFVGAGPTEPQLRDWAARHSDRVRLATNVGHDDVAKYLSAMDILVAPSQTTPRWREQFGRMLIEAFACELAVIGSDSGEIPHVIGEGGLVVAESDQAGWTRAIGELCDDAPRRREIAARGRARALERFAWPVVAQQHIDFFEQLLQQGQGRP